MKSTSAGARCMLTWKDLFFLKPNRFLEGELAGRELK
jgi:hypothetical protein